MKIFHIAPDGALVGEGVAPESPLEPGVFHVPAFAVEVQPPEDVAGKLRAWNGSAWEYRAKPEPVAVPTAKEIRRGEIDMRLMQIDRDAVRPLRALVIDWLAGKAPGSASAFEKSKVQALEAEAATLRTERAGL